MTPARAYNAFGEITDFAATRSGSPVLATQCTRDTLGRITQKTETVFGETHTFAYGYDQAGRLSTVTRDGVAVSKYDYDSSGNRIGGFTADGPISGVVDAQDRLLAYGTNTYSYTANGELKTKTSATGGTVSYAYDVLGNLRSVTLPNGSMMEYLIDGADRRIGKKVNGAFVRGWLYQDNLNPVAELDASGNVAARFIYASRSNVPDYVIKGASVYRIISDHLGSPRLVVDIADGTVAQRLDYDEFGNVTTDSNPGFQPFGFAGGLYDRHTELLRFGARDYDPETGRWTAKDPIGFRGGDLNLYGYVVADPVNKIDPEGLSGFTVFVRPTPVPRMPVPRAGETPGQYSQRLQDWRQAEQSSWKNEIRQPTSGRARKPDRAGNMTRLIDRIQEFLENLKDLDGPFSIPPIGCPDVTTDEWKRCYAEGLCA